MGGQSKPSLAVALHAVSHGPFLCAQPRGVLVQLLNDNSTLAKAAVKGSSPEHHLASRVSGSQVTGGQCSGVPGRRMGGGVSSSYVKRLDVALLFWLPPASRRNGRMSWWDDIVEVSCIRQL